MSAHPVQQSTLDQALTAVRRADLRVHADCVALLACVTSRLAEFDRCSPDIDLSAVLDALSDAEHQLEQVYAIEPELEGSAA